MDKSGPGSDGNQGVLCIPQNSSITRASLLNCLMSYLGHSCRVGSYPSVEIQSVYSTAPSDWALDEGVLPLCRDAVSIFYSPYRLGCVVDGTLTHCVLFFLMCDLKAAQIERAM